MLWTRDLEGVRILDTEQDYFKRGIKEAIYIRALQPSLNRDGGRYRLQTTFDPLLTSHVGKITCPQHLVLSARTLGGFGAYYHRATPTQEVIKLITTAPDPTWRRPRGRPRSRWEDQVYNVLDSLGVSRTDWRVLAENRTSWRDMATAAMHLP
ncbi:hypothetical protein Bbelb_164840 [Branchiostoma belcheri]|nr:hypothetical protein Bbelb_164840 [Branchiostoma belcheri]